MSPSAPALHPERPLLPPEAARLLARERHLLEQLRDTAARSGTDADTLRRLEALAAHLDEGLLVVAVGEFNAGKSSVLNALFGEDLLEEGPVPTTDRITILRHGDRADVQRRGDAITEQRHPLPLLRGLTLVDTPGTNSIIREHQALTEDFVPRSDLALFVTSFDRPLSESERQFLHFLRDAWGRQLVVVLNKADLATGSAELDQVIAHVQSGFDRLLGFEPRVFPVSARRAQAARAADDGGAWAESGFADLEAFLTATLTGRDRLALKLGAPLDAAGRVLDRLAERLAERRTVLDADATGLDALESQLQEAEADLRTEIESHIGRIDTVLLEMERRGVRFLDDTIRLSGLSLLRDRDRFKEEFARQVLRDAERQIETETGAAVDALLRRVLGVWNRAYAHVAEQARKAPPESAATPQQQSFLYDREATFHEVMREARRRIDTYDLREEARRLLENARSTAALFAGAQAAAVGLGALTTFVIAATAFDITGGLIAAGALSAAAFVLLPRQRRRATREFEG
ncbi:MAG: dynamin family protein, partial [Rhodothermales bacterium]|nr:dynamin family protein [Rhodothermales bacterium]